MKFFFVSLGLVFFISCGHVRSGKYIQVQKGDTLEKISKRHGVPPKVIRQCNPQLEKLIIGDWLFLPKNQGILAQTLREYLKEHQYKPAGKFRGKFAWPVPSSFKVTSHYGKRGRRHHDGIDISAPTGRKIVSTESGRVVYSGNKLKGYGNLTIISHRGNYFSVYAHASKNLVRKGQWVNKGQVVALVGSTGRSTGSHLHFEIRHRDKPINPLPLIAPRLARSSLRR